MANPFEELNAKLDAIHQAIAQQRKPDTLPDTLTLADAAKLCQISNSKMYEMAQKKRVPASKVDNRYVFIRVDLIAWLRGEMKNL